MKKLLLTLLLFIPYLSHAADTFSTGTVIVTLPSTNTHSNDLGQKINNGLQAIITGQTSLFARTSMLSIYDNSNTFLGNATTIKFNNNLTVSLVGSTATVNGNAGGGTVGNSTYTWDIGVDGPVGLATTTPATSRFVNKSTFTMIGYQAYVSKASSSSATMFQLVWTSATSNTQSDPAPFQQYGITYTPFTFQIVIATGARSSVYTSSVATICQDCEWGVRVTTITDQFGGTITKGLPAEGFQMSLTGWKNPNLQY